MSKMYFYLFVSLYQLTEFHSLVVLENILTFPSSCCYCAIICFCRIDLCHYLCSYFKSLFPALLLSYLLIHAFSSFLHTTVTFKSGCPKGTIWHTPFLYLFSAVWLNTNLLTCTRMSTSTYIHFSLWYICIYKKEWESMLSITIMSVSPANLTCYQSCHQHEKQGPIRE